MKKGYYKYWGIVFYILYSLLGIYLLSAGLINNWNPMEVLKSSIFWGVFFILVGMFHVMKVMHRKK